MSDTLKNCIYKQPEQQCHQTSLELSIIIPVYNEAEGLTALFRRLYPALDTLNLSYEIIFIDDGSKDTSSILLGAQYRIRPDVTKVILFNNNYGQHMAITAGFEQAQGQIIITMDADLQNPPEEIGRLIETIYAGHDYVGTVRRQRQDHWFRRKASQIMNTLRERITHIRMTDQGCMFRAYRREIIDTVNQCCEFSTFIPALAYTFSSNPTEIEVTHAERFAGSSKYSLYRLIRLNFDLITGFSILPLHALSLLGILLSLGSGTLFILLLVRRFMLGAEVEGVFTLFAINFFLIGVLLFGIGLLGEYIGRIYQQVRHRPRYIIKGILQQKTCSSFPLNVECENEKE